MAHSSREYQKDYMWTYRLYDRLKTESLQRFDVDIQKMKNEELQSLRQGATIEGLNFLLEQIPFLTEEQRKAILKERDRMLSKIDELIHQYAENMDLKFAKARIQAVADFDVMFEKVMVDYKAKIASDPKFRVEVEERLKAELNKIEVSVPFSNHGVV